MTNLWPTKRGFTLVELSIVLVIIGLLIGGVLVGKSIIDSARVNRLISDLRQYEVATVQFQKKFKKYPGDSQYFTPPGTGNNILNNGTGGTIDSQGNGSGSCAAAPNGTLSNSESSQFWAHLSQAQMLKTNYPAFSDFDNCSGTYSLKDFYTGQIAPYTKISPEVNNVMWGYASDRASIFAAKSLASTNIHLVLKTLPIDASALENKLGVQANNYTHRQIGLVNTYLMGVCGGIEDGLEYPCATAPANAAYGQLSYFLPPP